MTFFDKNSLWKHRNLGLVVNIVEVKDEKYRLAFAEPAEPHDHLSSYALKGWWTAAELVRDFSPQYESSKYDRLLGGLAALGEDENNPQG